MDVRFDTEGYLRGLGEVLLAGGEPEPLPDLAELTQAAGALVAAGAIDPATAQEVLDTYGDALELRSGTRSGTSLREQRARARAHASSCEVLQLGRQRIIDCDIVIDRAQWILQLHRVHLTEEETTLRCDFCALRTSVPSLPDRTGRPRHELISIPVTDDLGTGAVARFVARSEPWRGQKALRGVLAIDATWIEIDGARCELGDTHPDVTVTVRPNEPQDPGLRHLWHKIAIHNQFGGPPVDLAPATNALLASGAINDGDLRDLVAVHAMLSAGQDGSVPVSLAGGLPQPWCQLLARIGWADGPVGTTVVSTVLPPIDGMSVAIGELESHRTGFTITVQCRPSLGLITGYGWDSGERLAWWSADDRGNRYLGRTREWVSHSHSGREDESHGRITFWPALDPRARRLELIPTAERSQAVLTLALPWA